MQSKTMQMDNLDENPALAWGKKVSIVHILYNLVLSGHL